MLITERKKLEELCDAVREHGSLALDTEFVRERSFFSKLGVVQVAAGEAEAVIDAMELPRLDPLLELIFDPAIEVIVHAGRADFEIFYEMAGRAPANVFDTQVAAAFIGYGSQMSLANLVERVTRVELAKSQQLTDWTRRPLTKQQIEYALDDVRYLPRVRDHLVRRLRKKSRLDWALEECRVLEERALYARPLPEDAYLGMKSSGLNRKALGVLRELAAWRERKAERLDRPRAFIAKDAALIELARRQPRSVAELRQIRFLGANQQTDRAEEILAAIQKGLASPAPAAERAPRRSAPPPQAEALRRLLEAWIQTVAMQAEIAPGLLATRDQLQAIVNAHFEGEEPDVPVLRGWRRDLAGQDLLDILQGRLDFRVDPESGNLVRSHPPAAD